MGVSGVILFNREPNLEIRLSVQVKFTALILWTGGKTVCQKESQETDSLSEASQQETKGQVKDEPAG